MIGLEKGDIKVDTADTVYSLRLPTVIGCFLRVMTVLGTIAIVNPIPC